jgi:hypothetical protein
MVLDLLAEQIDNHCAKRLPNDTVRTGFAAASGDLIISYSTEGLLY